jgi:hypothetical protein
VTVKVRWQTRRQPFVSPLEPAPRTAVLVPWFRNNPVVQAIAAQALAGTLEQLLALAGTAQPTHALIVVGRTQHPRLRETDRDRLWQAFRVPVFEQIIGRAGELLAAECDAHDGLHVLSPKLSLEGERIDASPCACGRKTPRLMAAEIAELVRHAAAFAR